MLQKNKKKVLCIKQVGCSGPLVLILRFQVLREELGGCLQGLCLLNFDSVLAFLGASTSLRVCHAEYVVGLDATVEAAVPWNRVFQLRCLRLCSINTRENSEGIIVVLSLPTGFLRLGFLLLCASQGLLLNDFISLFDVYSVELVDLFGRHGLGFRYF